MNQDDYINGADGTLIAEFRAMEAYHRLAIAENSYSSSIESFPCHTLYDRNYMACLDIGAAGTFSGSTTTPSIDWDVSADAQWYKNVSRDYLSTSTATGRNLFGTGCAVDGGGTTQYGDGVINSFDIGVLIFTMFGDYPYDNISNYATTVTVDQRPETQSRCGNSESRADWQADLTTYNYCPSDDYSARQRRKLALIHANDLYNEPSITAGVLADDDHLNMPSDSTDQGNNGTHPINKGWVRTRYDGHNPQGSWHTFEFAPQIVPIILELFLRGVWNEGQAILSNAPPPANGDEVPYYPSRYQVRWSRSPAQSAFAAPGTVCKPVVTGATGTQTLIGDTLSVRQEGIGSDCPFQLHLWTPADGQRTRPGRQLTIGNEDANLVDPYKPRQLTDSVDDPRSVWAMRGSSAMTNLGPVTLNPSNTYELGQLPSLPPPPPLAPIEYSRLEAEITFTSKNITDAQLLVDALLEQKPSIDDQLYEFAMNVTTIASLTSIVVAPNETSAVNSAVPSWGAVKHYLSLLYPSASRRLSEDDCEGAAVMKVVITFDGVVMRETIKTLQANWPAPRDEWGLEVCGEIKFTTTEAEPQSDDDAAGVNVMLLAIIVAVTLVMTCMVILPCRRASSRHDDYYQMNKRGHPYELGTFTAAKPRARGAARNAEGFTFASLG
tara:strand:- start:892 stop:2886 length:1995 start_codon:yes stop_codon:yes gene_type:complete